MTTKNLSQVINTLHRISSTQPRVRVAAKELYQDFLDELAANTAANAHTENLLLLAAWARASELRSAVQRLAQLQDFYGSIGPELAPLAADLRSRVMAAVKQQATPESWAALQRAL